MGNDEQEKDLDRSSGREHGEGGMVLEVLGTPGTEGVLARAGVAKVKRSLLFPL